MKEIEHSQTCSNLKLHFRLALTVLLFYVTQISAALHPNIRLQPGLIKSCPKGSGLDEILAVSEEKANMLNNLSSLLERKNPMPMNDTSLIYPDGNESSYRFLMNGWKDMENMGRIYETASHSLVKIYKTVSVGKDVLSASSKYKELFNKCQALYPLHCNVSHRYRTMDGSCNNPLYKHRGQSLTCQGRLLAPIFQDSISKPRAAKSGKPLPLVRTISSHVLKDQDHPSQLNNFFQHFAQLLAHDVVNSAVPTSVEGFFLNCCIAINQTLHPQCGFTISIPKDDPFYRKFQQTCQIFGRLLPCPTCEMGPKSITNINTAFLDLSEIYGSDEITIQSLKGSRGQLLTDGSKLNLLPDALEPELDLCNALQTKGMKCFRSGDIRVNQQVFVTAMSVMLMRNHNYLAAALSQLNPKWSDELVFQESRKINIAMMQMITYSEVVPLILGPEYTSYFQLAVQNGSTSYDPSIDPAITTEFSLAAFRGLHSIVSSKYHLYFRNSTLKVIKLRDVYRSPGFLRQGYYDAIIRGLTTAPAQEFDRFFSEDVSNFLFRPLPAPFGDDLISFDTQRGRDSGLPPYVAYLKLCFQREVKDFPQLAEFMSDENWMLLKNTYEHIEDIDLFVGGSVEKALHGGSLGPTFACIIGKQFHDLRFGDRFYFEHKGQTGSFTKGQLKEIRKTTMASMICKTFDDRKLSKVPKNPFITQGKQNQEISCNDVSYINLDAWKD